MSEVIIIGAGLAGCEAALQVSKRGYKVKLIESKPTKMSAAHKSVGFAELVCSNSLKSNDPGTASGVLKMELEMLDCFLIKFAKLAAVKAGNALAVDRGVFSDLVTQAIKNDKNIQVINCEAESFDFESYTIIASGPLTHDKLSEALNKNFGGNLHFYDAAAPIVSAESLDYTKVFSASRYGKGSDDYLNCSMTRDEYEVFYKNLITAESVILKGFEKSEIFDGCMPIELMAKRGADTLRFGMLKPVGLIDPNTGKRPYAVLQLRAENIERTMYNLVGFQTNLKFGEQKRVFGLIPGLENAEFLRYGVMHRNTFINAPKTLNSFYQTLKFAKVFIAGQLSGVEGYVESIASGLMAAINLTRCIEGKNMILLPETTVIGALSRYLAAQNENFQPMNANFGLLPPLSERIKDKLERKAAYSVRAERELIQFKIDNNLI